MLRSAWFWLMMVLSVSLISLLFLIAIPFDQNRKFVYFCGRLWGKFQIFNANVSVTIKGIENIADDRAQILMPNHQSYFDIFTIITFPVPIRWMAKKEILKIPIFGWVFSRANPISVDRKEKNFSLRTLNATAEMIKDGNPVVIFPEGTRSPDGKLLPFKKGGFILAIKSQVPVVPITIKGSSEIMPKGSFWVRPGKIEIIIDKPIETAGYTIKDRKALTSEVYQTIAENLQRA